MDKNNIEAILTLSPAQQGMLFYLLLAQGKSGRSDAFLEQQGLHLRGGVDPAAFEAAWQQVFARHSALRTCFVWERREKPIQVVLREADAQAGLRGPTRPGRRPGGRAPGRCWPKSWRSGSTSTRRRSPACASCRWPTTISCSPGLFRTSCSTAGRSAGCCPRFSSSISRPPTASSSSWPRRGPHRDYIQWLQGQDQAAAERHWRAALAEVDGATASRSTTAPAAR